MAKFTLDPAMGIKSMSGAISRKKLYDGTIQVTYVTKKGRLYVRKYAPRTKRLTDKEAQNRALFAQAQQETTRLKQAGDPRKRPEIFKEVYARLKAEQE